MAVNKISELSTVNYTLSNEWDTFHGAGTRWTGLKIGCLCISNRKGFAWTELDTCVCFIFMVEVDYETKVYGLKLLRTYDYKSNFFTIF
jgi:hypothetical protein